MGRNITPEGQGLDGNSLLGEQNGNRNRNRNCN